jgi:hypothetical protein
MTKRSALRFVLMIGVVSLFADFTYEGSGSVDPAGWDRPCVMRYNMGVKDCR